MKRILQFLFFICVNSIAFGQSETFSSGSYIINMGSATQTISNGLKPYGLIYELLKTYKVPVKWIIKAGKAKDAKDFTYASVDYKGGTFIIPKAYITSTVAARITVWEGRGVVGVYTTSSLTISVTETLTSVPNWTLNNGNINISKSFFVDAGIPSTAYNNDDPANLNVCNDIFVMPHSTPTWSTHGNLYKWNRTYKGAIWSSCYAVSLLENLVNPSDTSQKLNLLTTKGLIDYNAHSNGTPAYNYFFNRASYNGLPISARPDDPVFQMIGIEDAAHTNGFEQIYIPDTGSAWRNTTHIGCYDSIMANVTANAGNGPAAITLYGRGHGLSTSGLVMYQGGHDIEGTNTSNIAALRQFFNFSFEAMKDKVPTITATSIPPNIQINIAYKVSVTATSPVSSSLSYLWTSTCAGTFDNSAAASTTFTPTNVDSNTIYSISCVVTDACSRYSFSTTSTVGLIPLPVILLNFDAKLVLSDGHLTWSTVNEGNVESYEVYRSFNGHSFYQVGRIKVTSDNSELNEYIYVDKEIAGFKQKNIFYRLKIIDYNNRSDWSDISLIKFNQFNSDITETILSPNPASDIINITFNNLPESDFSISIIDHVGRVIKELINPELNSEKSLIVDIKDLENGIYFVYILNNDGCLSSNKFIKR